VHFLHGPASEQRVDNRKVKSQRGRPRQHRPVAVCHRLVRHGLPLRGRGMDEANSGRNACLAWAFRSDRPGVVGSGRAPDMAGLGLCRLRAQDTAHRTAWRWGQHATTLRLAQYLIDDSAKDSTDKQMLAFDGLAQPLPQSDDSLRLRASFQLPEDAPAQGAQCGGLRVDWRLELLSPEGRLAFSCPVAVRAAATPPATPPPAVSPTAPSAPPAPGHSPAAGRARPGRAAPSPAR